MREVVSRPETSVVLIVILTFLLCVALDRVLPTIPQVQDEFSYLLAADTFSEGRLTNPTHVLWRHFETTHVIQRPSYQSKYPPGQGLALALGHVSTGSALVGVWISLALACAAVCWMLQAWLPLRWAFLGGFLAAANGGILRFWGGTFMGGAVAMLGGALLFGALARSQKDPRPRNGIVLALGLLVLAMTRPYEGLIASLPAAATLLGWVAVQKKFPRRQVWKRLLVPILMTLALGACWLGYYNYRVTGNPLRMPYQEYLSRHEAHLFANPLAEWSGEEREDSGERISQRYRRQAVFHLGGKELYAVPLLLALPWLLRSRWARFALGTSVLTLLAASLTWKAGPHYSAPIAPLVVGLLAQSIGIVAGWIRWRVVARVAVGSFVAFWLFSSYSHIQREARIFHGSMKRSLVAKPPDVPVPALSDLEHVAERRQWERYSRLAILARQGYVDRFERDEDRHLILVRYAPGSNRLREWIYNRADIDGAASVWAMWMPTEPLWPLLTYFSDRRVWLIEPERAPWEMQPFPVENVGTWYLRQHGGAQATVLPTAVAVDPVRVEIWRAGAESWHVQIERAHPPVEKGKDYVGAFRIRADAPRSVWVDVSQGHEPWLNLGLHRRFPVTEEWQTFSYGFGASQNEALPRLVFGLGHSDISVEISAVQLSGGRLSDLALSATPAEPQLEQ